MQSIQSIYALTTDNWTPKKLRKWIRDHGLKPIKSLHRNGRQLRYRITDPSKYSKFRVTVLRNGVHIVRGFK